MIERITQIMEREGLTPSKFAEAIGIQRSAMSHILNGRNNVSLDVLIKILDRFAYVDSDWLIQQETVTKKVSKIMVFYSDNTFDTFISEKNKKE